MMIILYTHIHTQVDSTFKVITIIIKVFVCLCVSDGDVTSVCRSVCEHYHLPQCNIWLYMSHIGVCLVIAEPLRQHTQECEHTIIQLIEVTCVDSRLYYTLNHNIYTHTYTFHNTCRQLISIAPSKTDWYIQFDIATRDGSYFVPIILEWTCNQSLKHCFWSYI